MFRFDVLEKNEETRKKRLTAFVETWWTDSQLVVHIPLGREREALIDPDDFNMAAQFYWHAHKSDHGTAKYYSEAKVPQSMQTAYGQKRVSLHRLLMGFPTAHIDHKDGNGLNCRRGNLRIATQSQNASNRFYQNKTGFRGVRMNKGRFEAQLDHHGIHFYLGTFHTAEEAAVAYNNEAKLRFGEFAVLNEVSQ